MGALEVEAEATEVGIDPERLGRIRDRMRPYVDDGLLPGWLYVVARAGKVVAVETYGHRDVEAGLPVEVDTLFRLYSMTKPITSVAALMLWEQGAFELKDPVARFLPDLAGVRVWRGGSALNPVTEPVTEPLTVWNLLTHTAGFTYGFHHAHPVDAMYRAAGFEWGVPPGIDSAEAVARWAQLPLVFQPGAEWNYGVSTDVLGRLVEVVSGQPLDRFFAERIFGPLGMTDTAFAAPIDQQHRLAALYVPTPRSRLARRFDSMGDHAKNVPTFLSGGGGLVGTGHDYHRFATMLLRHGVLDGCRVLGPRSVAFMTSNHLPGGADLTGFGRPLFAETAFDGVGFGLGVSVTIDPVKAKVPGSVGDFSWGGAASTTFWVDPTEELTCLFLTQLLPSSTHPLRSQLKALVHQALVA